MFKKRLFLLIFLLIFIHVGCAPERTDDLEVGKLVPHDARFIGSISSSTSIFQTQRVYNWGGNVSTYLLLTRNDTITWVGKQ